ncbi:MAG: PEGA domain-containing protein [Vitreimonas sp.]
MRKLALAALPLAMSVGACATVTRGMHEAFTVETEPSGAMVETSNGLHCDATPCTFARVERKAEFTVTITKPGYRTWSGNVTHHTAGAGAAGMAGNVLVGGLIGVGVDATSGATQDLTPNPLHVALEAEASDTPAAAPTATSAEAAAATPAATTPASATTAAASTAGAPAGATAPTAAPASPH